MHTRKTVAAFATAICCFGLLGTPALADLKDDVSRELQREQIQVGNLDELNEPQLRQIQMVLRGGEPSGEKRDEIQRIASSDVPCLANDQIRSEVQRQLQAMGMTVDVTELGGTEVSELLVILSCDECSKDSRIRQVLDRSDRERVGEQQLRAEVGSCLQRMNIDTAGLDSLTPAQVAELELVLGGADTDADKRQQVQRILGQ
jgi:hypothetical protein